MSNKDIPLVSVYIPSHNRPDLATRAIKSVLNQTYPRIQILLCNDGSNTADYSQIKIIVEKNKGIYLENSTSLGAPASRNRAIAAATGHFITGLDDDDEFTSDRIQGLVEAYEKSYSFLATSYVEKSESHSKARTYNTGIITHYGLLHYNQVGNQIFIETKKLQDIGGFDEAFPAMQDHELWIRIAKRYGNGLKLPALTYIVHTEHEMERISNNPEKKETAMKMLQAKHAGDLKNTHYNTHKILISRAQEASMPLFDIVRAINPTNYKLAISSYLANQGWRK